MPRRHGENKYFQVGEDVYIETSELESGIGFLKTKNLNEGFKFSASLGLMAAFAAPPTRVFKYGRMFRGANLLEFRPERNSLVELGKAMEQQADPGDNPYLPAGYVYLGQFIDHDLTFDQTQDLPSGEIKPEDEKNLRSPALDLDSLYGYDSDLVKQTDIGRKIYEDDGIRMRVGDTIVDSLAGVEQTFPNDLPKMGVKDPQAGVTKATAAIVDGRNDENLAIAQTHLAFIKFHNVVVDQLSAKYAGEELFKEAREKVVRHYQWIILCDYLPKIIEEEVLKDVIENGCQYLVFGEDEEPFMPVEFSVAAFRFGHSLVRERYRWNRIFEPHANGYPVVDLLDLFSFTGFGAENFLGNNQLPSSWIIDWTRFYDFTGLDGVQNHPRSNSARRFSPSIVSPLMKLPNFMDDPDQEMHKLSVRNLLRGRLLGLPSGQDVARRLKEVPLTPEEIADGPHRDILTQFGSDETTPLWYYILKEAERRHGGDGLGGVRLGPVGSRIVAETFVGLIKKSRVSILPRETSGGPVWKPDDLCIEPGRFSMPDLLYVVHRATGNYLNPLGDKND
jgi:hypothetical protein